MKRRNFLLSAILVLAMLCCACGSSAGSGEGNPFEGKWIGRLDVTKQFEDGIKAKYQELEENMDLDKIVDFEELVFVLDIAFENGEMSMAVQQDSVDTFMKNFETGMQNIGREALEAWMETQDMTLEEVVAESGMDEAAYLADRYEQMGINQMASNMKKVTNTSLEGLSKVKGAYTFDDKNIHIAFEDNTFEEMQYTFEGGELTIIVKGEGFSLHILCEKR